MNKRTIEIKVRLNRKEADAQSIRAQLSDVRDTMGDLSLRMSRVLDNSKSSKQQR